MPSVNVGDSGAAGQPLGPWQRLSQSLFRPPPEKPAPKTLDFGGMSDDEKRAHIVQIDPSERKVGLVASALGAALALYANVPYMVSKISVPTTVKPKGRSCGLADLHYVAKTKTCNTVYPPSHYVLPLVVSLVLAAAIYVTVRIRRRAPLAFTMAMTGLAFGSLLILVPYGVGAGWIMLRAWRTQKYGSPAARSPVTGWVAPAPRAAARRANARSRRTKTAQSNGAARKPPEANKRYTPKSPPKKKPAPPAAKKATPPTSTS
jgi:hypothetical protein